MQQAASGLRPVLPVVFRYYSLFINKTFDLMRKARFRVVLAGLFAAFALMLFAGQSQAQIATSAFPLGGNPANDGVVAPLDYITAPEAINLLDGQTASLKSVLGTLVPGTQAYKTVETSFTYYTIILSGVVSGKAVEASLNEGFLLYQYPDYVNTPVSQMQALYEEALELLTN
jgi:hypothetical protein